MSDSSDDDVSGFISPSSIRPSIRRDVGVGSSRQTSTIVKAAARRQLRGDSDKKPVKEVAAEIRRKLQGQKNGTGGATEKENFSADGSTPYKDSHDGSHSVEPRGRQVMIQRRGVGSSPGQGHVGIGIKFTEDQGDHIVTSLLPEGPADATRQVFKGDKIIAVDGVALYGKSSNEVIDLILGPPGMFLTLTLQSGNYDEILSPGVQQTPGSHSSNGLSPSTHDLRSVDSYPSQEFELVSPGQARDAAMFGGGSPLSRECSVGIKFLVDKKKRINVQEIMQGTPAEECKRIHVGDTLVRVDGIDVEGKEETAVETLISGVYGSPVSLTVESGHDRERRSVKLLRKEVVVGRFILKIQEDESAVAAASGAANRDNLVPAPQEPTPARAQRPDDQDQASPTLSPEARMDTISKTAVAEATVPLEKYLELERRVHKLEEQVTQQAQSQPDVAAKLRQQASEISDMKTSVDKKLDSQQRRITDLAEKLESRPPPKAGCGCVVS